MKVDEINRKLTALAERVDAFHMDPGGSWDIVNNLIGWVRDIHADVEELRIRIDETLDAAISPRLNEKLDEAIDARIDETLDETIDARIDKKLDDAIDARLNEKLDETIDARLNEKLDDAIDDEFEALVEDKLKDLLKDAPPWSIDKRVDHTENDILTLRRRLDAEAEFKRGNGK